LTKKLDIMNSIEPGKWAIVGGKVQRIKEFVPEPLVVEKEEKEELKEKLTQGEKDLLGVPNDITKEEADKADKDWEKKKLKKKKGGKK